uniref:CSON000719 protein n=1 Tax=Culicoides sonorensis TaxID=179676 RepID=A0A336MJH2_CULSO
MYVNCVKKKPIVLCYLMNIECEHRQKRTLAIPLLIVPPTAPTRHQLIWGIGIPSQINYESVVWGIVLKAQYYLANTASGAVQIDNLKPAYWPGIGFFGNRRKRELVERYNVSAEVLEEESLKEDVNVISNEAIQGPEKDTKMTRWIFYEMLEKMAKE